MGSPELAHYVDGAALCLKEALLAVRRDKFALIQTIVCSKIVRNFNKNCKTDFRIFSIFLDFWILIQLILRYSAFPRLANYVDNGFMLSSSLKAHEWERSTESIYGPILSNQRDR